jgi:transcriptional regulator with XRE-family HTH domain
MTSTKDRTIGLDRAIGLRVRTARNECGMSQEKLGTLLGITFQQVQKYEKGMNRVSSSALVKISEVLKKPISYFLDEVKYKPNTKGEQMAEFVASREGSQLIAAAMELPPKLQQTLIDLARDVHAHIPA